MAEVAGFAEIGDYLDQPVRTYSSGMQVRLAFSIATVIRPDILIVDEALSVGDIYFQQKCFDRIRGFRDAGTTLLFVSHSLSTVYSLCSRAIYLEGGVLQLDGTAKEAIDLYQARVVAMSHKGAEEVVVVAPSEPSPGRASTAPGSTTGSYSTEGVTIRTVRLLDGTGRNVGVFFGDQEMTIEIVGAFDKAVDDPHFGFQVRDRLGQPLFMTTTHGLGARVGAVQPGETRTIRFRFRPGIAPGEYTVTAGIANRGRFDGSFEESLVRHQDVAAFTVVEPTNAKRWAGMINLQPTVEVVGAGRAA
jgi:lipopolysaccharide transport system ATP-binding protein